ncbi:hypothetical protein BgiMline_028206 [Biomphalaria glabrata]
MYVIQSVLCICVLRIGKSHANTSESMSPASTVQTRRAGSEEYDAKAVNDHDIDPLVAGKKLKVKSQQTERESGKNSKNKRKRKRKDTILRDHIDTKIFIQAFDLFSRQELSVTLLGVYFQKVS